MTSGGGQAAPSQERANAPDGEIGFWPGFKEIYARMSRQRRRQFYLVLVFMLLGTIAELATIGAVIPFLALLADPAGLIQIPWITEVFDALGASSDRARLIAATAAFCLFAVAAGILRLQLSWSTQDFIFRLGHEFSVEIQRRILFQPYSFHIHRNTSSLLAAINKTEVLIFDLLLPMMQAATAAFIAIFIVAALFSIDPFTATIAALAFTAIYLLVSAFTRRRLAANSREMGRAWDERLKIAQESLGGIRDVILDNSQEMYVRRYAQVDLRLSIARATTAFISSAPRFVIETVGMIVIAILALMISQREGGLAGALPVLGAVALGAQRLLPLLQQVYGGWSNAAGNRSVLGQILDLLRLPISDEHAGFKDIKPLPLKDRIRLDGVSFGYPTRRALAIEAVSLEIPAGSTLALIGETGSGKSTLADLLMGLLEPTDGEIRVDGIPITRKIRRRWQRSIAHVPQSIFLADTTVAGNIALAVNDDAIDLDRVIEASKKAQLHDVVSALPDGYKTVVGERGIRLSGGQRQRLGIARAIYRQAPVLILDEATNALDTATEAAVIDALDGLCDEGRTIVIIGHRHSAIARCDFVARLQDGRLVEFGPFAKVAGASRVKIPKLG